MNRNSYLLDAQGRQMFSVAGPNAWRVHDAGEYMVSMEWADNEPAMVLFSKVQPRYAFVICLSSIGKYATPEGKPNPEGVDELAMALPDFGKALERTELHRVIDIVLRYTPELIGMPPIPPAVRKAEAGRALWEVTEKEEQTGRIVSEATI